MSNIAKKQIKYLIILENVNFHINMFTKYCIIYYLYKDIFCLNAIIFSIAVRNVLQFSTLEFGVNYSFPLLSVLEGNSLFGNAFRDFLINSTPKRNVNKSQRCVQNKMNERIK